jgi:hypothetical protein
MDGRGFSGWKVSMNMNGGRVRLTFQAGNLCNIYPIDWASPYIGGVARGYRNAALLLADFEKEPSNELP